MSDKNENDYSLQGGDISPEVGNVLNTKKILKKLSKREELYEIQVRHIERMNERLIK